MEFFKRIFHKPLWASEIIIATVLANILVLATPLYVIQVLNRYIPYGVGTTLLTLTIGVLVAILFELFFRLYRIWVGTRISQPFDQKISIQTFGILTGTTLEAIERLPVGFRQAIIQDADVIKRAYNTANLAGMLDLPFVVLYLIIVLFISFWLFIIGLIGVGCLVIVGAVNYFLHRKMQAQTVEVNVARAAISNVIVNQPVIIRVFNAIKFLFARWQQALTAYLGLTGKVDNQQQLGQNLSQTITAIVTVFVLCIGAILVVFGHLTVGALIGANILSARALMPVSRFTNMIPSLMDAKAAKQRLHEAERLPLDSTQGNMLKSFSGRMELRDLSYGYHNSPSPLFESVDLELKPGRLYCITGPNGSGKSTLMKLLVGLLEPTRGQVLIDGVELRQVVSTWWRHQICYLPQEAQFFEGTIRENIMVANEKATAAGLNNLIKRVDLGEYLDTSMHGLDEVIKYGGNNISLGVRRRVALARSLITDGKVVVFDEPVEGLDPEGVQAIYHLLGYCLQQKKVVIVVTYDKAILGKADCIIDLSAKPSPDINWQSKG